MGITKKAFLLIQLIIITTIFSVGKLESEEILETDIDGSIINNDRNSIDYPFDFSKEGINSSNNNRFIIISEDSILIKKDKQDEVIEIGTTKQLFIDDYIIESTFNISKVLNQGKKTQQPIIVSDMPWEKDVYLYGSVLKESGLFKMWYHVTSPDNKSYICYATSIDGLTWEKPNLGVFTFNQNTNNNIIMEGIENYSIIRNPDTLDYRTYLLYGYNANTRSYETRWSADGVSYFYLIATHLFNNIYGDVCNMFYDYFQNEFVATYKMPSGGIYYYKREFYNATTTDLVHFTNGIKMETITDSLDIQTVPGTIRTDCYGMGIFPYEGVYIGFDWIFYINNYNNGAGTHSGKIDVHLVFSRDLRRQWQRTERKAIIQLGDSNEWDSGMIFTAGMPLIENNEVWMYYGGFDGPHKGIRSGKIGLAKWRLDGFTSLNNNDVNEGIIETKALMFTGTNLAINTNSSKPGAYTKVELLDIDGFVIPGFSKNDCTPITSNDVRKIVSWGTRNDLTFLQNTAVKIKFYTSNSEFYAFQFENNTISHIPVLADRDDNNSINIVSDSENNSLFVNGVTEISTISIYNLEGRLISKQKSSNQQAIINTESYTPGIYLIVIDGAKASTCRKYLKQ